MIRHRIAWVAILGGVICLWTTAQAQRARGPAIRQADHILVESSDPGALFSLFADTLQLPVAWPLARNQGFVSGGVGAGNVNLEFFRYADRKGLRKIAAARFAGLAFEPYPLSNALRELQARGIPFSPPEPYVSTLPKGSQGVLWTTVALPSVSRPLMSIFLYEYNPLFLKVEVRREQLANRLTLNGGGPLGFQSVSEVVIATTNLEKDVSAWKQLLGEKGSEGTLRAGTGPAIRLIRGTKDEIQEIVFKVKLPGRAETFLKKNRLSGYASSKGIYLNPLRIQGLRIRLTGGK